MQIGVPAETAAGETRVAVTPETAKKLVAQGHTVAVQAGAGIAASVIDTAYQAAGATITDVAGALGAEMVLKVRAPSEGELAQMKSGAVLVGMLNPFDAEGLQRIAGAGVTGFALEAAPRTTRAQSMDVLSSQANIAGYKAVMIAADKYQRFFPMLMTASDVRPSVKEQIESLGGKFIEVSYDTPEEKEAAQGVGGYAKPMPPSWLARQQIEVAKRVALADIVISTALIPGRAAPTLITEEMVKSMKPGSVIVDIAAGKGPNGVGGNCPLSEADKTVVKHGVTLVGDTNLAAGVAADASALYARNLLDFLKLIVTKEGALNIDLEDDIVAACRITHDGQVTKK